jgi:hypothetical protein
MFVVASREKEHYGVVLAAQERIMLPTVHRYHGFSLTDCVV